MENLTKKDVFVRVESWKDARKLFKVLTMFQEKVSGRFYALLKNYNIIDFDDISHVWEAYNENIFNKTQVTIKQLKQILAKEKLKPGDYFIGSNDGYKFIGKFSKFDNGNFFCSNWGNLNKDSFFDNENNSNGWISTFKRYATKEEIEKFEGNKEVDKFAELKEAHKNGEVIQYKGELSGKWIDTVYNQPSWNENYEYRIKPDDKPKVGDVVKYWWKGDDEHYNHSFCKVDESTDLNDYNYKIVSQQEVNELLFGKPFELEMKIDFKDLDFLLINKNKR